MYDVQPDWHLFERTLDELKRSVSSWGGKFYVVYLPEWDRFGDNRLDDVELYNRVTVASIFEKSRLTSN